jgi:hypothetical protein
MNWLGFSLLALGLWGLWGFMGKVAPAPARPTGLSTGHFWAPGGSGLPTVGGAGGVLLASLGSRGRPGGRPVYGLGSPIFLRGPGPGFGHGGGSPHRALSGCRRGFEPDFPPGGADPAPLGRAGPGDGGRLAVVQVIGESTLYCDQHYFLKKFELTSRIT